MAAQILFVDDEAPVRELLSLYFRKKGFNVTTATSVAEGRQLAAEMKMDLAILDIDIASESGLDLLRHLKNQFPSLPVVMFTGLNAAELSADAIKAGAAAVIAKNQSLGALYEEVVRHLPRAGVSAH